MVWLRYVPLIRPWYLPSVHASLPSSLYYLSAILLSLSSDKILNWFDKGHIPPQLCPHTPSPPSSSVFPSSSRLLASLQMPSPWVPSCGPHAWADRIQGALAWFWTLKGKKISMFGSGSNITSCVYTQSWIQLCLQADTESNIALTQTTKSHQARAQNQN